MIESPAAAAPGESCALEVRLRDCYDLHAVTAKSVELPSEVIRAEQAARVAAMFDRWAAEDVSDEPEWDVDQVEQIVLSSPPAATEPRRS
jgi:hypothetical protein